MRSGPEVLKYQEVRVYAACEHCKGTGGIIEPMGQPAGTIPVDEFIENPGTYVTCKRCGGSCIGGLKEIRFIKDVNVNSERDLP